MKRNNRIDPELIILSVVILIGVLVGGYLGGVIVLSGK